MQASCPVNLDALISATETRRRITIRGKRVQEVKEEGKQKQLLSMKIIKSLELSKDLVPTGRGHVCTVNSEAISNRRKEKMNDKRKKMVFHFFNNTIGFS